MRRSEAATAFAVMAGVMFLLAVMTPFMLYAFGPSPHDRTFLLVGFLLLGAGIGAALYGISLVLQQLDAGRGAAGEPAGTPAADPREELTTDSKTPGAKPYGTAKELMSSIRTLIELENWKLAHQRASELLARHPQSEEASKVKKNLDYLQRKATA
jgi:hypothetical protein